jgi:hypothetical protein
VLYDEFCTVLYDETVAHPLGSPFSGAAFSAKRIEAGWSLEEPDARCNTNLISVDEANGLLWIERDI